LVYREKGKSVVCAEHNFPLAFDGVVVYLGPFSPLMTLLWPLPAFTYCTVVKGSKLHEKAEEEPTNHSLI
jgi:hypothetical protein